MGLLSGVETNPDFATGSELSGALLNVIQSNTIILDAASRHGRGAFCEVFGEPPENVGLATTLLWRGGFKFVAGATTLTVVTSMSGVQSGDSFVVNRRSAAGVLVQNSFAFANGEQTHAVSLTAAGYAHDEVVVVEFYAVGTRPEGSGTYWGVIRILDAYISPIAPTTAWPGVPLFGAISEANLDQLSNAATWLARAIGLRTEPLFQAVIRKSGPYATTEVPGHVTVRWRGSIVRTNGHPQVRALIRVMVKTTYSAETVVLKVGGVVVSTYTVPLVPGDYTHLFTYDASAVAVGARMDLEIQALRTGPLDYPRSDGDRTRLTIYRVWSEPSTGAIAALPPLAPRSNATFGPSSSPGTLLNWLNTLRNQINAIKARLDANPEIWARQTLYRARYAFDDGQFEYYEPDTIALSMGRIGTALIVRGKGITVGYGPGEFDAKPIGDEGGAPYPFTNFKTLNAIDADEVETQRIWLDSVPALPPFAPFNLRGVDLFYAAEELLPEEP
jgi:hypothetical protein